MSQGAQKLYRLINYSNQRKRNYLLEGLLVSLSFVVLKGMICIREKTESLLLVARIQQLQAHHPERGSIWFRIYDSVKLIIEPTLSVSLKELVDTFLGTYHRWFNRRRKVTSKWVILIMFISEEASTFIFNFLASWNSKQVTAEKDVWLKALYQFINEDCCGFPLLYEDHTLYSWRWFTNLYWLLFISNSSYFRV